MEESLRELSGLIMSRERDWSQYSPLPLAYLGDAVFDLVIRTLLVERANMQADKLHHEASSLVNARFQARMAQSLMPELTTREMSVYRRGRNAKPSNTAKNATREEYLEATGLEALMGFLYLQKEFGRLSQLIQLGLERCGYSGSDRTSGE